MILGSTIPMTTTIIPETVDFLNATAKYEQYKLDIVQPFKETGRLLEIGPSTGTFAWIAKQSGYDGSNDRDGCTM